MCTSRAILVMIVAALSAGCSDNFTLKREGNGAELMAMSLCQEAAGIIASDAWMRSSRAGQPTSAAYLTLANCGEDDDALIAVSFEGAGAAELHTSAMTEDGIASMTPTKGVPITAGAVLSLKPGGGHIMLIGMNEAIEEGANPVLTLEFEKAAALKVVFEVRNATHGDDHSAH